MEHHEQPIGYWLKLLDQRIDHAFDRLLADAGLHRRHWQTLQLLGQRPHSESGLAGALAPFFVAGAPALEQVLADLTGRGWATLDQSQQYVLTAHGRNISAQLAERIGALRRQTTAGVSQDDYRAALAVLERMADNLARATR